MRGIHRYHPYLNFHYHPAIGDPFMEPDIGDHYVIARRTRETLRPAWVDLISNKITWQYHQIPTFSVKIWKHNAYLSVCLPGSLPACLPVCLPVCVAACLPGWLSGCLFVCLSVCLSVCSIYLSIHLYIYIYSCISMGGFTRPH